jgi:hypothetical protein
MRLRFLEGTFFRAVSGQDVAVDSCTLGIFDELRRFLAGSGVQCVFVGGYQTVQGPMGSFRWCLPWPGTFRYSTRREERSGSGLKGY